MRRKNKKQKQSWMQRMLLGKQQWCYTSGHIQGKIEREK
jgi:hypothetical protein